MKIVIALLLFAFGLLSQIQAQPLDDDATSRLVDELTEQARNRGGMVATFSEVRTSPMLLDPIESGGTLVYSPPTKFRLAVTTRPSSETVCNGDTLWIYYPDFNEVEVYSLDRGPAALRSLITLLEAIAFHDLEKNFDVTAAQVGADIRLDLQPRSREAKRVIAQAAIRLDAAHQIQGVDWTGVEGDQTRIQLSEVRAASAADQNFEFEAPDSARIVQPFGE